jgi:hypothetical protein
MTEPGSDFQVLSAASAHAEDPARGRQPFIRPTVEDLGRLKELTLVGGSL